MRLCLYSRNDIRAVGFGIGPAVADLRLAARQLGMGLPDGGLLDLIEAGPDAWDLVRAVADAAQALEPGARTGWTWAPDQVQFHAPFRPRRNILRLGGNRRRPEPMPRRLPYFTKAPTAVIDPEAPISWPLRFAREVSCEPQLVAVLGRVSNRVPAENALQHVFGYAVATDVSAADLKLKHGQWIKGASLDTFFPWGPFIVTADEVPDPMALPVRLRLNGEVAIEGSTGDCYLTLPRLLAEITVGMTLDPGDLVLTGAPEANGFGQVPERWLRYGDVVESEIEGIGRIRNPVHPS